jgi:hypothetical protein
MFLFLREIYPNRSTWLVFSLKAQLSSAIVTTGAASQTSWQENGSFVVIEATTVFA